jgi:hypothetical protein
MLEWTAVTGSGSGGVAVKGFNLGTDNGKIIMRSLDLE